MDEHPSSTTQWLSPLAAFQSASGLNRESIENLKLFDREPLWRELEKRGYQTWAQQLRAVCQQRLSASAHGNMPKWIKAWNTLPESQVGELKILAEAVAVEGICELPLEQLRDLLMQFHPWRKGPFDFLGLPIDTEWRSNLKWDRLGCKLDFEGKTILDVGCGNGYYGWRMLAAGADFVLGCDPFPLYLMQFEVFRRYAKQPEQHYVIPLADHELPSGLNAFDLTFSMGVLYHRTSPIDHLQTLWETLKPGGQLVLETLIVESQQATVLVPEDRYAKMRNVWFIPSVPMLELWLRRCKFADIEIVDVTRTTSLEQRRTPWMTFESLDDFLESSSAGMKTVEGYPTPVRAILTARRDQA